MTRLEGELRSREASEHALLQRSMGQELYYINHKKLYLAIDKNKSNIWNEVKCIGAY